MNDSLAQVIAQFLDVGITGAVSVLALWYAYRKEREVRDVTKEKEVLYERMIKKTDEANRTIHGLIKELNQTVDALAESLEHSAPEELKHERRSRHRNP